MTDSSADRNPLNYLAEEFVGRFRAGQRPSLTENAERHPDLAGEIRDLFPALVEMEQLKPGTGEHTGDFAPIAEPSDPDRVGEFRILRRVWTAGRPRVVLPIAFAASASGTPRRASPPGSLISA
jgi:hypothetical protein